MKIAVLIRDYDFSGGGSQKYCVELTNRLSEIHDVHVYAQNIVTPFDKITFHKIPRWFTKPRFLNQLIFSWLTKKATNNKYDIVHSHDTVTHADVYTLHVDCVKTKWTNKKGLAKFLYFLDTLLSPRMLSYLWLEYRKLKPSPGKKLIIVSGYLEQNILASYPNLKPYLLTAQPGINIENSLNEVQNKITRQDFRKKHNIPKNAYVLLFIAHDFKRKGIYTIIKALEILNYSDIYLIVAGKDNPKKITFNSDTVQSNTLFLGSVSNMDAVYPGADTLIHPTLNDTYGMVVLESMLHQLSVIVSNKKYCGISEYIENKEAIILKDPKDEINLSNKIDFLYNNVDYRNNMSKHGLIKAKAFTWERTLEKTLKAYKESIDR